MGDIRMHPNCDIESDATITSVKENLMYHENNRLNHEKNRFDTFTNWPAEAPVPADRIARAGFYYTGEGLIVECFSCGKQISTWQFGDQVSQKHVELNPNCDFVKNKSDNVPNINAMAPIESREPVATPSGSGYNQTLEVSSSNGYRIFSSATAEEKTWDSFRSLLVEAERLRTFKGWPLRFIKPEELARAGFFYLKDADKVQCIFCRVIISEWEEGDIPITEHHRHSSSCRFIMGFDVGNVSLGDDDPVRRTDAELPGDDVTGRFQYEMEMLSGPENGHINSMNLENSQLNSLGITRHAGPKHPNYATCEARMRTFRGWSSSIPQDPENLVDAGFYYAGVSDHVRCFYCDGGLRNWEPTDDPWVEHARWFGKCTFLLLVKGQDFVLSVKNSNPPHLESNECVENVPVNCQNVYNVEINGLMETEIVKVVLGLGLPHNVVRWALEKKLKLNGIPFSKPDDLYEACLEVQKELSRSMPSSVGEVISSTSKVPNGVLKHSTPINGTIPTSFSTPNIKSCILEPHMESKTEAMVLLEENQRLKEMQQCKICMAEEVGVVFLPCGHLITCPKCAPCVTECPLCRRSIAHTVRTYLS